MKKTPAIFILEYVLQIDEPIVLTNIFHHIHPI